MSRTPLIASEDVGSAPAKATMPIVYFFDVAPEALSESLLLEPQPAATAPNAVTVTVSAASQGPLRTNSPLSPDNPPDPVRAKTIWGVAAEYLELELDVKSGSEKFGADVGFRR